MMFFVEHGSLKLTTLISSRLCQLVKPAVYGSFDEENVCDMLSTLTLHRPFPEAFHGETLKCLQMHFDHHFEDKVHFWKSAHTRMFVRIEDEMRLKDKDTSHMMTAIIESIGALKFSKSEFYEYAVGIIEWMMEDWVGMRAALLDGITWIVKRLDREQVTEM